MPLPISSAAVSNAPTMAFSVTGVIEQNKGKEVAVKLTESDFFCGMISFAKRRTVMGEENYGNGRGFHLGKRRLQTVITDNR